MSTKANGREVLLTWNLFVRGRNYKTKVGSAGDPKQNFEQFTWRKYENIKSGTEEKNTSSENIESLVRQEK